MKRVASVLILCLALLPAFFACSPAVDCNVAGDAPGFVNLDISVVLSDVSDALTKADDKDAANDNEKMQSLRIVIVRPDLTVEANRRINLKAVLNHEEEYFKVAANERKMIYLFVNEDTEIVSESDNIRRRVVDYELGNIIVGRPFPKEEIENLTINMDSRTGQLSGPLPMSGMHYVDVPGKDHSCSLFVARAAVKFTFRITNKSSKDIGLNGLAISKMASKEWYMPRAEYNADREIIDYEVPPFDGDNGYYIFRNDFSPSIPLSGSTFELKPIYLLEGKYNKGYSLSIMLNGSERRMADFDNLPMLARNTHVVVNITIKEGAKNTWEVDVVPYDEIDLGPVFGLDS